MKKFIMNLFKRTKQIIVDETQLIPVMRILNDMRVSFGRIADVTDMVYESDSNYIATINRKWTIRMRVNRDEWERFVLTAEGRELSSSISYAYAW